MSGPVSASLAHVFDIVVEVGKPDEVGDIGWGERRVIPIISGVIKGSGIAGTVRPGGADFQIIRPNGFTELKAQYCIELDGGGLVYVENTGIRFGTPEALANIRRGIPADPAQIYFRSVPRFETAVPELAWLQTHLFVAAGARRPTAVELSVYKVL